ncbi:MAG: polysaccharide deacetylase family protein [Alphaproteobacteria bacterium]|jgi:peptidoglycan/xylan/chitin deacetylase (PgdA/CDA1 family)|nr:polysaccharide deacetylase family protein [Alphaproteobacteria bacterium]
MAASLDTAALPVQARSRAVAKETAILRPALAARLFPTVVFHGPDERPAVALTLDDGPDPATTPALLDTLDRLAVRATFFLIGERAAAAPELVAEIAARGHEIGHHMWKDRASARLEPAELVAAMDRTLAALAPVARPRWLRPGLGAPTERLVAEAEARGMRVVVGDVPPLDTHVPFPRLVAAYTARMAKPGAILTVHDAGARGVRARAILGRLVPTLRRRGLAPLTLGELVP